MAEKEPKKEFRFECVHCGECCFDKNTLVNLTYTDIYRLKNGLNLSVDEILEVLGFYVFEEEPSEEQLNKMVVPPIFTEHGLSFIGLRKDQSGKCYFYNDKEKRCLIYKLRPNFCRTFPFSFKIIFNERNGSKAKIHLSYTEKGKSYCPGISKESPLINEEQWIILGKETIEHTNDNNILIKNWNMAVKDNKITPNARNFVVTLLELEKKLSKEKI